MGACEPATGLATTLCRPRRHRASCMPLLAQGLRASPAREWALLLDHLRTHASRETPAAVLAWPEVPLLRLPPSAGWLPVIEPWGTQRRSLAVTGRRVAHRAEVLAAIGQATASWHAHRPPSVWKTAAYRWKKTT